MKPEGIPPSTGGFIEGSAPENGDCSPPLRPHLPSKQANQRIGTLIAYAQVQYELGLVNDALHALEEAVQETEQLMHTPDRVSALIQIAEAYSAVECVSRAEPLLDEAVRHALQIVRLPTRAQTLRRIASAQYQLGLPSKAQQTLHCAFETELVEIRRIANPCKQALALVQSAQAQARAGLSALAERTFEEAVHVAFHIVDLQQRTSALRTIARMMSQTGRGDTAVQSLFNSSDSARRTEALRTILREQIRAGQYERVLSLALQLSDASQREELLQMAQVMGVGSDFGALFHSALRLSAPAQRSNALSMLLRSQFQADRLQSLIERVMAIEDVNLRQEVARVLAETLLETDKFTKGTAVIFQLPERTTRHELVQALAIACLQADQVERLLREVVRVEDDSRRVELLALVLGLCVPYLSASGLMEWLWRQRSAQRRGEILRAWFRVALGNGHFPSVMSAILNLGEPHQQKEAFHQLAGVLHQNRSVESALQIASRITEPSRRKEVLRILLNPFLTPEELERAVRVVARYPNTSQRKEAFRVLVQEVGATSGVPLLLNTLLTLPADGRRESLLQLTATTLAEGGWYEPALQSAHAIQSEPLRTETLFQVGHAYIRSGRYPYVLGMALQLGDPNLRHSLLESLMSHFFDSKQYDLALEVASQIPEKQERAQAYVEIAHRALRHLQLGHAISAFFGYIGALLSLSRRRA